MIDPDEVKKQVKDMIEGKLKVIRRELVLEEYYETDQSGDHTYKMQRLVEREVK